MDVQNTHSSSHKNPPFGHLQVPPRPPAAVFLSATIVIFFLSLSAADSVGFVPDYSGTQNNVALSNLPQLGEEIATISAGVLPERIVIPAIGMNLPIQNPATKDIDALTEVLKAGPARYVDSAQLGEKGNMLVFGHSSQLPVVRNQMYKAFNNISNLKAGDTISVYGGGPSTGESADLVARPTATTGGSEYLYSVVSVRAGDANEEVIDLSRDKGTYLTLVTCNTLGEKSARWIVEAEFIGSLPSNI